MDLTPVKQDNATTGKQVSAAGDDKAGRDISIDPITSQNMGVRTEAAARRMLSRTIRTIGLIDYAEDRQFSVNSKIEGWIEKLYVNQEGQMVKLGQPLMEIYSPELVAAQQEYLLALENSKKLLHNPVVEIAASGERLLEAARTRLKYWDINDGQIKALEKSGQVSKTLTLFSPHGGIVMKREAIAGMRVLAGEELLQISDISLLWIYAQIYEYELPLIKVGQVAKIDLPFAPDQEFTGKITYIYPYLKNETRTARARIELANPGLELKPDMYANVIIEAGTKESLLAIPANAVLNSGKGQTVFVAKGDGRFEPRKVRTGIRDEDGYVSVLSGLQDSEQVVTSAQFMLDSESTLREALQKMMEPAASSPGVTAAPADPAGKEENLDDLFK